MTIIISDFTLPHWKVCFYEEYVYFIFKAFYLEISYTYRMYFEYIDPPQPPAPPPCCPLHHPTYF